jgi:glycosyltransferase involved in cell wall biosynthesis
VPLRLVSAVLFSPRGGSAHLARALARGLRELGWSVTLIAGSRGDAEKFYGEVEAVDFRPALETDAPLRFDGAAGTAPIHPSYEDRENAPDVVFAKLDDADFERQVRSWGRALERAGAREADVLHLHHLTPLNEAAARVAPDVPVVGQLHGTELLMLEQIAAGPPDGWTHAKAWSDRLRAWAGRCARLVIAPGAVDRAVELLEVPRERIVALPGGVDVELFAPRDVDRERFWSRILVDEPRGWLPDQAPGSVRYERADVERLARGVVVLYVGRFTAVKRVGYLIEAFGRARELASESTGLVLVGGHPGEWEGEHPAEIAARRGVEQVFLAGWHDQQELPEFFAAADAVVIASEREQFGEALVEGMACGRPAIATRSIGPESIIDDGETGWLTAPDDPDSLARAIAEAVSDRDERLRRGERARSVACERFSWSAIAARFAAVLEEAAVSERRAASDPGPSRRPR